MPSKQQNKNLLFVYGSLKRGFDNHQLLKNATFIAEAKTLQLYSMLLVPIRPRWDMHMRTTTK